MPKSKKIGTKGVQYNDGKVRQFLAAILVNLTSIAGGIGCGWPSPIIPQLQSNNPPVGTTPMSEEQISWVSSLLPIGSVLIVPFCGVLAERLGRKNFALLAGLPHVICWSMIIFGQTDISLYVARLLGGMGSAMSVFIVPLYVSEIASEDIRGKLGSLLLFSVNIGILVAYTAGAYLSYRIFAVVSLLFPLVFFVTFAFMPETPVYLMRTNRQLQAYKSLSFFRGNDPDVLEQELAEIQFEVENSESSNKRVRFGDLFRDRATRKGLVISFMLLGSQQLSGIFAMLSYAETIFKLAGSSVSSKTAPIIIGVIQILGSYMSTMLMERAGRRLLTLISCLGMAVSYSIVALFFYLQRYEFDVSSVSWLPLVALSTYIVNYCLGIGPVPFVVTSEVFRQDISSFATTLCYVFYWSMTFAAVKTFGPAMQFLGAGGCFVMLAIFCAACTASVYWILPETMGRHRQDIIDELAGIKRSCDEKNLVIEKGFECNETIVAEPV